MVADEKDKFIAYLREENAYLKALLATPEQRKPFQQVDSRRRTWADKRRELESRSRRLVKEQQPSVEVDDSQIVSPDVTEH